MGTMLRKSERWSIRLLSGIDFPISQIEMTATQLRMKYSYKFWILMTGKEILKDICILVCRTRLTGTDAEKCPQKRRRQTH